MSEDAQIPIGKVVGIHGIKGCFKVLSFAESAATFEPGRQLALRRKGKPAATFKIASASPHKRVILVALEGIASIDAAKEWVGSELWIDKATLPEPEVGTYYGYQIIGMEVLTVDGRRLGRVEDIWPTGSNDVYVVRQADKEILIPAIDSVVMEIDPDHGVMRVEDIWPTGSNDVYVVRQADKEILIPAIDSVVMEIDPDHGVMRVDLPEGLEE